MNMQKDPFIVYAGRFNPGEKLSGPEKTAKRLFIEHSISVNTCFIQYFFDGRQYSLRQKLFGEESASPGENATVLTLGLFRIFKALRDLRPEIIHIVTFERFAIVFIIYSMFYKTKIVYNVHGVIAYENSELKKVPLLQNLKDRFCERLFIRGSDKLIFNSENVIDLAERYYRVDESKAVILPNGIDEEFRKTGSYRSISPRLKAVFMIKNELSRSGLEFLNDLLNISEIGLDLFIIADKQYDIKTNENVNVTYGSPMTALDLARFYEDKDIFLSLNRYDTFSISTAEAMASGLIPVVTSQTGINRYIDNGNNGFIVDYGDRLKLNEILKTINGYDETQRHKIQDNAVMIYESLAWKNVYEMYLDLYRETAA